MASVQAERPAKIQKRLEILIIANNPKLLELIKNDNDIWIAARCNSNAVVFSDFVPFKEFGKIGGRHRVFVFEEFIEAIYNPYAANLRHEVINNNGEGFIYRYDEKSSTDLDTCFLKAKKNLVKDLALVYKRSEVS